MINLKLFVTICQDQNIDVSYISERQLRAGTHIINISEKSISGDGWRYASTGPDGILNTLIYKKILYMSNAVKNAIVRNYCLEMV
jgi:hypothetical protein